MENGDLKYKCKDPDCGKVTAKKDLMPFENLSDEIILKCPHCRGSVEPLVLFFSPEEEEEVPPLDINPAGFPTPGEIDERAEKEFLCDILFGHNRVGVEHLSLVETTPALKEMLRYAFIGGGKRLNPPYPFNVTGCIVKCCEIYVNAAPMNVAARMNEVLWDYKHYLKEQNADTTEEKEVPAPDADVPS